MSEREDALLTPATLPAIQAALAAAGVDGWLLYDFRGLNPIARAMVGLEGMGSRRIFAWVPVQGTPVGLSHAIEQLGRWQFVDESAPLRGGDPGVSEGIPIVGVELPVRIGLARVIQRASQPRSEQ